MAETNNNENISSYESTGDKFDEIKTLTTQNGGKKRPRLFSDKEYERRLTNLRIHMEKEVIYAHMINLFQSGINLIKNSNNVKKRVGIF